MKRVLIIGYFGERNTGDEGILTAMLRGLRKYHEPLEVVVPTYGPDPAEVERAHGVVSFLMSDIHRMFDAVEQADLVLLGGGGLLHDIWRPQLEARFTSRHGGLTYYCGVPWLAAQIGKPLMLYAVGVGPLVFEEGRDLVRDAASAAQIITVRDETSGGALKSLGINGPSVEVTADPTWLLSSPSRAEVETLFARAGISSGSWLGVAVRNWDVAVDQRQWAEQLLRGVEVFAEEHDLGVLFLPFQQRGAGLQDDIGLARTLAGHLRVRTAVMEGPLTAEEILGMIGKCALLVSMRLHSLIFACITGTPAVALVYDPKVAIHAALLRPPLPAVPLSDLTGQTLRAELRELWDHRSDWAHRQRALALRMRRRAERNTVLALRLLEHPVQAISSKSRQRIFAVLRARASSPTSWFDEAPPASPSLRKAQAPRAEGISDADIRGRARKVRVIVPQFLDPSGEIAIFGGSERYLIELSRVIRELGYEVEVFQPSGGEPWVRDHRDMRVVGVSVQSSFEIEEAIGQLEAPPALTVHLAFYTAGPLTIPPAIGISHGVYWDDPYYHVEDRFQRHRERILTALEYLDAVVSVDTNTINWVSATSPRLAEKWIYIPNFVDIDEFRPATLAEAGADDSRIVILFPRRLVVPRGFWVMVDIVPSILDAFPEVEFHFVGQASGQEEETIKRLVAESPDRVRWEFVPPEQMPRVYRRADIVVIPTLYSEGTSLACLEAQASGKAVVATRVGGLPNLILNEHNGLLVEPHAAAVRAGIERLIRDPALRTRLSEKALETAQLFGIERWRERWSETLRTFLSDWRGVRTAGDGDQPATGSAGQAGPHNRRPKHT